MAVKTQRDKNEAKIENRRDVLDVFRNAQIITVAEAAARSGLSKATVHRVADFLRKKKLLLPAGKGISGDEGGKKPTLLAFNAGYRYILCFQVLANALLSAIADLRGNFLAEHAASFPRNTPLAAILAEMRTAYGSMAADLHLGPEHFAGAVVGCHGITDSEAGVIIGSDYFPAWGADVPFRDLVRDIFDKPIPIYIDNSNRYNAYAELRRGRARESRNFIVIDGETHGVGSGIVVDRALWRGSHFLSGEIGHMTVDPEGKRRCACGARGCLETMASMNSLVEAARKGAAGNRESLLAKKIAGGGVNHRDIYDVANAGDAFAREVVAEQARWLAIGVGNVSLAVDIDLVVLQGPFSRGGDYFLDRLRHFVGRGGLPRMPKTIAIEYSAFGRERGLVGGAHYVADRFFADLSLYEN